MRAAFAIGLLGFTIAASAEAQTKTEAETGSLIGVPRRARIADDPGISAADRGRLAMAEFARCTVDRRSVQVAKVATLSAQTLNGRSIAPLADDECLASGSMAFKPILLRGALFVELYGRRTDALARGQVWRLQSKPFDQAVEFDKSDGDLTVQMGLLTFSECVVGRDPAGAKAVVSAPTVSKAEDAGFGALRPSLGRCYPAGSSISLSKPILKGALAEILYRGTVKPVPSASQEAK